MEQTLRFLSSFRLSILNVIFSNMGGWDINCAFCGASFRNDNAFNEDDSERDAYNPSLISEQGEIRFWGVFDIELMKILRSGMAGASSSHWIQS